MIGFSAWKLIRKTVGKDVLLWLIVGVNAVLTAVTEREIVSTDRRQRRVSRSSFVGGSGAERAALLVIPPGSSPACTAPPSRECSSAIGWYFAKAGAFVFGSGLAIVPFLHGGVVQEMHWLTERQFLDAVAVSMITPGPVVITVAFIGYLVAGPLGAIAAAIGRLPPGVLIVVVVARWFQRVAQNRALRAAVDGVTAAATGAIAGAVFVLGRRAIVDGADAGHVPRRARRRALGAQGPRAGAAARRRRCRHSPAHGSEHASEPTAIADPHASRRPGHVAVAGDAERSAQSRQPMACSATATSLTPSTWRAPARAPQRAPTPGLRVVATIPLPGPTNRFDYQSFDPARRRLYINHMNAGHRSSSTSTASG